MVSQISPDFFEPEHWQGAGRTAGKSGGRGAALYISHAGDDWVLRHYYRGGLPGRVLRDQFLWVGAARTRSLREWDLLQLMVEQDLITRQLPDVMPFSTRLTAEPAPRDLWQRVGESIARFHSAGFYHADLNAHNLQVDAANNVFLLDWDRGEWRVPGEWRTANLARLHRSLLKISRDNTVHFKSSDWDALLQGYAEN